MAASHQHYCDNKSYLLSCFTLFFLAVASSAAPIAFNYKTFRNMGNTLNLTGGDASLDINNGALNLTYYGTDSLGRVKYHKLLHLWDKKTSKATDFTTHFTFSINTPNKTYNSDGITFYLAQPNFPLPTPRFGGGIGLLSRAQMLTPNYTSKDHFVAVEFDTFGNVEWDPILGYDHVGVDINSMATPYTREWFTSQDERKYDVDITYNATSNVLAVFFTGYKDNITRIKQQLSADVDLREKPPEWVEFGFSSATGMYYEYHTLFSWSFNSTMNLDLDLEAHSRDNNERATHKDNKGNQTKTGTIIGVTIGACALIGVFGLAFLMGWKLRRKRGVENVINLAMDRDFERSTGPRRFSYAELSRATYNFANEHKIGKGGFGEVYRGFLRDLNMHVAIKRISQGSQQGVREYASEVKIISQLRHKNLVQLIGWCHEQNDLLLVYEYVENGSLDSYLFKGKGLLTWEVRYKIARGLASALLYLHEEWDHCVLHRDIKPSNVMLDSNFNAKLGDFGLARLMEHGTSSKTTDLAGTLGYLAPEAATRGKASKESDVFSFGVVILEIACGRKVIEQNKIENQIYLVDWVWELYGTGIVLEAGDPRLYGVFDKEEMERLMIVGLWCTHSNYVMRPKISEAARVLNHEAALPTLSSQEHDGSTLLSRIPAFSGNNQTQPSTSSSSVTAGSSQSGSATSQLISPSSKILHTR
ncbi:L-type lectin-domain containing receptor kinase IX [Arachis hypogaea]|nr:L-type lectin-domain containing receptor kinase IX [Arachis hypogaea]